MSFSKDKSSNSLLFKSTLIISLIVIASKVLGFVRDATIAAHFGASYQTDAFFFALSMPGIPAISMSLSTVFLPRYVTHKLEHDKDDSDRFASNILTIGALVALIISLIAILLSPIIVKILAPGFDTQTQNLAIQYMRVITCTLFLIMVHYILLAILNANKVFGLPQLSGIIINLIYIVLIPLGVKRLGIHVLLVSAVFGAIAQVLYLWVLSRKFFSYHMVLHYDEEVKTVFKLTVPVLLGNAIIQIHEIVDNFIGSTLPSGSISVLSYGLTLSNIVKTIIINAVSTVFYPLISEQSSKNNRESLTALITSTYEGLIVVLLPISLITIICNDEIVRIVYQRGTFSLESSRLTSSVLLCYAIGFLFSGIREISSKVLYTFNKMSLVTKCGAVAVIINIVLSYVLSKTMGVGGVALATSISECIAAVFLMHVVKRDIYGVSLKELLCCTKECGIALLPLIVIGILLRKVLCINPLITFLSIATCGLLAYLGVLLLQKNNLAMQMYTFIRRKLF